MPINLQDYYYIFNITHSKLLQKNLEVQLNSASDYGLKVIDFNFRKEN